MSELCDRPTLSGRTVWSESTSYAELMVSRRSVALFLFRKLEAQTMRYFHELLLCSRIFVPVGMELSAQFLVRLFNVGV